MAANYSNNAQNPTNQSGGQPQGQVDPNSVIQKPKNPKNIRDYVAAARDLNPTNPTLAFTNKPGGEGHFMPDPEPQAISEGPQSEYERIPFAQRMKINPYMRAQSRVKTMLPELWSAVFPGTQPGVQLDEAQMKQWQGAVESLTGNLLKQFDKQYEWSLKNESSNKTQRAKDEKFWHSKYVDADLRGQPPLNKETGQPLTAQEFITERMSVQDELKFSQETETQERADSVKQQAVDFSPASIGPVIQANPEIGSKIKQAAIQAMQEIAGYTPTEQEFDAWQSDPQWAYAMDQATEKAIEQYREEIMQLMQ